MITVNGGESGVQTKAMIGKDEHSSLFSRDKKIRALLKSKGSTEIPLVNPRFNLGAFQRLKYRQK
jgi:hypothetical protein